jgi:hypothetical protein
MNTQNAQIDILDNDVDGIESIGQAAEKVVQKAGQAMVERKEMAAAPAASRSPMTPMEMVGRALEMGVDPETLKMMMDLRDREESNQARKAFDAAMAAAKSEFAPILTNRRVAFEGKGGKSDTNYKFEDLAQIERQVGPVLAKNGLSYRYRTLAEPDQPVRVTCVLAHRDGHYEETTLAAGRDGSGNKNSIQQIGSTITYLQRYTLKAALGLAVTHDDDGKLAESIDGGPISDEQVKTILRLCEETATPTPNFCQWAKIESVPDLPAADFDKAVKVLEMRRRKSA